MTFPTVTDAQALQVHETLMHLADLAIARRGWPLDVPYDFNVAKDGDLMTVTVNGERLVRVSLSALLKLDS